MASSEGKPSNKPSAPLLARIVQLLERGNGGCSSAAAATAHDHLCLSTLFACTIGCELRIAQLAAPVVAAAVWAAAQRCTR